MSKETSDIVLESAKRIVTVGKGQAAYFIGYLAANNHQMDDKMIQYFSDAISCAYSCIAQYEGGQSPEGGSNAD